MPFSRIKYDTFRQFPPFRRRTSTNHHSCRSTRDELNQSAIWKQEISQQCSLNLHFQETSQQRTLNLHLPEQLHVFDGNSLQQGPRCTWQGCLRTCTQVALFNSGAKPSSFQLIAPEISWAFICLNIHRFVPFLSDFQCVLFLGTEVRFFSLTLLRRLC